MRGAGRAAPAPLRVDLDGIAGRVAAFPVSENRFEPHRRRRRQEGRLERAATSSARTAAAATRKRPGKLEVFDFATLRSETLADKAEAFELAGDGTTLVFRDGKRLRALAAEKKPGAKAEAAEADGPPSRKNGWIDLERLRVSIEPRREWRQMLREVWRLQRDQFWSADMSGVDWEAVYRPLRAAARPRRDARRAVRPHLGDAGRARHLARLRDGRRPSQAAAGRARLPRRRGALRRRATAATRSRASSAAIRGMPGADSPLNAIGVEAQRRRPHRRRRRPAAVARDGRPQALLVHQAGAKLAADARARHGRGGDAART